MSNVNPGGKQPVERLGVDEGHRDARLEKETERETVRQKDRARERDTQRESESSDRLYQCGLAT